MYSGLKYLFQNVIEQYRSNNNKLSGGLPHSEIHGSKLILSSPWLIAEYHVFHRLLLPRHPPNALLALDLIQKEQDISLARPSLVRNLMLVSEPKVILSRSGWFDLVNSQSGQKHTFRPPDTPSCRVKVQTMRDTRLITRVSVLDLDNTVVFEAICCKPPRKAGLQHRPCEQGSREGYPLTRKHQRCRYYFDLSIRCKSASDWTDKHSTVLIGQIEG